MENTRDFSEDVPKPIADLLQHTALVTPVEELIKILEENSNKWTSFLPAHKRSVNYAGTKLMKWHAKAAKSIHDIIDVFCKNGGNNQKKLTSSIAKNMPLSELLKQLKAIVALYGDLNAVIVANEDRWQSLDAGDQRRITVAMDRLTKYSSFDAIADVVCSIVPYETKGEDQKSKCIEFVLSHFQHHMVARMTLSKISTEHPNAFIPHTETICNVVDDAMKTYGYITFRTGSGKILNFVSVVIKLLPVLVPGCDGQCKYQVCRMLLQIVDGVKATIGAEEVWLILDSLKLLINDADAYTRCGAYDAFIYFVINMRRRRMDEGYRIAIYTNLLQIVENYCLGHRTGVVNLEEGNDARMVEAFKYACIQLGANIVSYLPNTMERLLSLLNPLEMSTENLIVIGSIDTVAMVAGQEMQPHFPLIEKKLEIYLTKIASEHIKAHPMAELANAIGNGQFMRLFVGIALKLFAESGDHAFRAGLYALFDAIVQKRDVDQDAFLSKLAMHLTSSVKLREMGAAANVNVEKKQAMLSLKLMASCTGRPFSPYIQLCFEAVHGQLNHAEEDIRQASVQALAQFVVSFFQMEKIDRSQKCAAKIIPDFAKMLKTDSSSIALCIVEAYRKLLRESAAIFTGETKSIDGLFNCVKDIMEAKLACQADIDFYDNTSLVEAALDVLAKLTGLLEPADCAAIFDALLPVLCERLEHAKQLESNENAKSLRTSIYHALAESIRAMKAYASTSFDVLFPLILSGMRAEYKLERRSAVLAIGELLINAKEKADGKSAEIAQEFFSILVNEKCVEVVDAACGSIARSITDNSSVISVDQFLPKLVQKLKDEAIDEQREDTFKCFLSLMEGNNEVLVPLLDSVVLIAFKLLARDLNQSTRDSINAFLKECRQRFGSIIEQALTEVPGAAEFVENL